MLNALIVFAILNFTPENYSAQEPNLIAYLRHPPQQGQRLLYGMGKFVRTAIVMEVTIRQINDYSEKEARVVKLLDGLDLQTLESVLFECVYLVATTPVPHASRNRAIKDAELLPPTLEELQPMFVRIYDDSCWVFLNKGLDTGTGLRAARDRSGIWTLYRFSRLDADSEAEMAVLVSSGRQ